MDKTESVRKNIVVLFLGITLLMTAESLLAENKDTPSNGSLSDTNIRYIGRWDKTNPNQFKSYWACAYIRVDFTGKSIGINLASGTNLAVSIDGETPRAVKASSGITQLNVESLAEGTHTLLLAGAGQNEELSFLGLKLESGEQTLSPKNRSLIEFVGDSNTAGTGPEGTSGVNYAWNTAEALDCDHTQIAFSGISLSSDYGCLPIKIGMDSLYFNLKNYNHLEETPIVPWNFAYTPDIVVINLGTNDECGRASEATVKRNMSSFLDKLRSKYPSTHLAVMRPYSGIYSGPLSTAVKQMSELGDTKVHYIDTEGWLSTEDYSDGIHTNAQGGAKVVNQLSPILKNILSEISSISSEYQKKKTTIVPNPVKDFLTIESPDDKISDVSIFSMDGKKMMLSNIDPQINKLDLQNLSSGTYTLIISFEDETYLTQKIIKM